MKKEEQEEQSTAQKTADLVYSRKQQLLENNKIPPTLFTLTHGASSKYNASPFGKVYSTPSSWYPLFSVWTMVF